LRLSRIIIIISIGFILIGCGSRQAINVSNNNDQNKIEGLEQENKELVISCEEKQSYIEKLESEAKLYTKDIEVMKENINKLEENLKNTQEENNKLKKEIEVFKLSKENVGCEFFKPNNKYIKNLVLDAVSIGNMFTIEVNLDLDYNITEDNERYALVVEDDIDTLEQLKQYLQKIYTKEIVEETIKKSDTFKEIDGKLYASLGAGGSARRWDRDNPILINTKNNGELLIYQINVYHAFDEFEKEYTPHNVEIKFIEDEGWRVNTFISAR
jgi:chromosome segregation ATPase